MYNIIADLEHLDIKMTFGDIKKISVNSFKNIVKKQIRSTAFKYLQQCQQTHSKSKHVLYNKFEMEEYLRPGSDLTIQEKQFIFKARTHMMNVKLNFKIGLSDLNCRHGCQSPEDQNHVMSCQAISDSGVSTAALPEYTDIYGDEVNKLSTIGRILMTKSQNFNNKPSAQSTGATAVD